MGFEKHLRKLNIDEMIIEKIMNVDYPRDKDNPKQDLANFMAVAMQKCEELLDYDTISEVMYDRACCKSGARLKNSRLFAKENKNKTLEEKLSLLGNVNYMGKPFLNKNGDIETVAVGSYNISNMTCPCWHFNGAKPANSLMPLSYCKCCAGHFRFHYQKALGLKLRLKEVVSSILNSDGKSPCVFIYEII
ncbi:hypothetical protein [Abyssisolibacter fermentans]|uniref:hypothetical protein n=1 Tax=Abyssisolibacter fermentans TaxID=1766203 RepID=UPI0008379A03|nr:hypothetical protein [Abyssisolibacter fermentans]